jgi:hypothetical protein
MLADQRIPSSAERKFARGVEQMKLLGREVHAFENRAAYVFRLEVESRTPRTIRYRCLATEREPPSEEWPLLAGDAIQNIRNSLDHVVWACAEKSVRGRDTAFPICTDPDKFQSAAKKKLRGVPEVVRASIEKWQPYRTWPDDPARDLLAQLHKLSNNDKHRALTTVATAVRTEAIGAPDDIEIKWEKPGTNQPLGRGETHVSTFVAASESDMEDLDLEPMLRYEVRIEGSSLGLLTGIVDAVNRVLVECETGQPLSMFARSPLRA